MENRGLSIFCLNDGGRGRPPSRCRHRASLVLSLLAAVIAVFPAAAAENVPEEPASIEASPAAESPAPVVPPEPATASATMQELARHEAEIARLEVENGPFHPAIAELMTAAARMLMDAGRFDDAVSLLRRALQIRRVNDGLHNLAHVELLEQIIENDFARGDAEALDRDYQHLYWIYRRNFGDDDPRLVPLLEHVADQHIRAYHVAGRGNSTLHHAVVADQMNDRARAILAPVVADQTARYAAALNRTAVINYLVARDALDAFVSIHEIRAAMIAAGRPMFETDGPGLREEIARDAFFKGALALKAATRLAQEREADDPVALAAALAFEGDWYWVFRRKWDASRRYQEAWDVLMRHPAAAAEVDHLFGQPRRLEPLMMPDEVETPRGWRGWVEAVIEVPDDGWPNQIRVTSSYPPSPEIANRGALGIAAVMYRPRMEDGKPVATSDVPIRYYLER